MNATDTLERIVPDTILKTSDDGTAAIVPVSGAVAYPPNRAPDGTPIRADYWALELQTARGSRWFGFTRAPFIGPDLRMHVYLDSDRDEVRNGWETPNREDGTSTKTATRRTCLKRG